MREDATFYEVLDVDADASTETIEAAYREQVKEYHPDVSDRPNAREAFQRINRAREVLTDPTERARYDRLGHETYLARQRRGQSSADDTDAGESPPQRREPATSGTAEDDRRTRTGQDSRRTRGREDDRRTRTRTGNGATDDRSGRPGAGGPGRPGTDTADGRRAAGASGGATPGWFALHEALSATALLALAGGAVAAAALLGGTLSAATNARLFLVGCWTVVAVLAGTLAARSGRALPDDVVRVHAFPLALFVGAWYLRRVDGVDLLIGGLLAYGAFAALFRTSALVGRDRGSTLRPALVWFLGTAPAVLVLPASRVPVAGRVAPVRSVELGSGVGGLGPTMAAVLALGAPVAVALGYAFVRLGRALV
ncbi:DnaJ domain-containing protein [Haloglomus halophilum]|uniref:DnaJ domain-containing protein n=1 Tax=Haloglomus halophilum TaxID=2962672 RepID=UPI0020CA2334|nr:DnaJ domain-containing protein [Haloglomus halophilum]